MSTESASLEDLGIQEDEMDTYMESLKSGVGNPARQICICGHAIARHTKTETHTYCKLGRLWCSCREPIPVLEPDDLRAFVFSTSGIGKKHALAKGLHALRKSGKTARWIIERFCFRCGREDGTIFPSPLSREKRITNGSGYANALLCETCVLDLGGYPIFY